MIKVGDRFENTRGSEYVVVEYLNYEKITVEFCDEHKYRVIKGGDCVKSGNIKNPYAPLLFGVGYHGVGPHKSKAGSTKKGFASLPAYSAWTNMLSRCYDKNYLDPHLYENSEVHPDWHCFQTFADWYYDKLKIAEWEGRKCLDKDILGDGTIYSPETCCLVPASINRSISKLHGGKYLPGVLKSSNGLYGVVPGYGFDKTNFETELEAHLAFLVAKQKKIIDLANKYKSWLNPRVYDMLCTKDFRFKFSPFYK